MLVMSIAALVLTQTLKIMKMSVSYYLNAYDNDDNIYTSWTWWCDVHFIHLHILQFSFYVIESD